MATVTVTLAETSPEETVTTALPLRTAVTRPSPLTVATDSSLIAHFTAASSMARPFSSRTEACSRAVSPASVSVTDDGSMVIVRADWDTVTVAFPCFCPAVAVISAVPLPCAVTSPPPLTDATEGFRLDQTTAWPDKAAPASSCTCASSCTDWPIAVSVTVFGVTTTFAGPVDRVGPSLPQETRANSAIRKRR